MADKLRFTRLTWTTKGLGEWSTSTHLDATYLESRGRKMRGEMDSSRDGLLDRTLGIENPFTELTVLGEQPF